VSFQGAINKKVAMHSSLAQTETSSEAVWTVLSRHLADTTQLVNCSTAAGQQPHLLTFSSTYCKW